MCVCICWNYLHMESASCLVMDYLKLRQFCCKSANKVTLSLHRSCFPRKLPFLSRHLVSSRFSCTISFLHTRISNEVSCALITRLSQLRSSICYVSWTRGTVDCRRQEWMLVISICPSCFESSCGRYRLSSYWIVVPLQMSLISTATVCINRIADSWSLVHSVSETAMQRIHSCHYWKWQ